MKVHFSVVEEFLDELRYEQCEVEDEIVRLTFNYEQMKGMSSVYHMSVIAGFVVRGKLVYLKQPCGDVWKAEGNETSVKVRQRADDIAQQIEAHVEGMNLALRRGVFES